MSEANATDLMQTMRMSVDFLSAVRTEVSMPVAGNTQPYGILHGGATAALAETAASFAANEHARTFGTVAVGTNLSVAHLKAVRTGQVSAIATADHLGKTSTVHTVRVEDEEGRLIATASVTNRLLKLPDQSPGT